MLEQAIRAYFADRSEVAAVYLFGSEARGSATAASDVDIAVLYARTPSPSLDSPAFADQAALERTLERPVDLVSLNRSSVDLVHRVLRDGRLIVEREPAQRIAFEVSARNRYFDLKPILDAYRSAERHA